jgi:hypothetical protein
LQIFGLPHKGLHTDGERAGGVLLGSALRTCV